MMHGPIYIRLTLQSLVCFLQGYFICQHFGTPCLFYLHTYPPMKMEQRECSEKLAYKIQTPGNHSEESTRHSEHDENWKLRTLHSVSK